VEENEGDEDLLRDSDQIIHLLKIEIKGHQNWIKSFDWQQ